MAEALGQFVASVFTESTGGGCMVDFIVLIDGRVVGLNDECVVLYPSQEAFYQGDEEGDFDSFAMFWRPRNEAADIVGKPGLGTYIDQFIKEYTVDVLVLDTGEVIGVDNETVCLYQSLERMNGGEPDSVLATISLQD